MIRLRKKWTLWMCLFLVLAPMTGCLPYFLLQPDAYQVTDQARAVAEEFLLDNVCLNFPQSAVKDRVSKPRKRSTDFPPIEILSTNNDFYEIGANGKVGLRAFFEDGKFVGYQRFLVEMNIGYWYPNKPFDFYLSSSWGRNFMACFFDEMGNPREISFPDSWAQQKSFSPFTPSSQQFKGGTRQEIQSWLLGRFQALNLPEGLSEDQQKGSPLPPGSRIEVFYKHNEHVYGVRVDDERNPRAFYLPEGRNLLEYIDPAVGATVPGFVK